MGVCLRCIPHTHGYNQVYVKPCVRESCWEGGMQKWMSYNVNEVIGMTDRDKTREELSAKLAEAVRESNIPEISDPEEVKRYLLENGDDHYDGDHNLKSSNEWSLLHTYGWIQENWMLINKKSDSRMDWLSLFLFCNYQFGCKLVPETTFKRGYNKSIVP